MNNRRTLRVLALLFMATLLLPGCNGGGTSGSGIRTVQGSVYLPDGSPLPQASVTLLESGDSAPTDEGGRFAIATDFQIGSSFNLEVSHPSARAVVPITNAPLDSPEVTVDITIDPSTNSGQANLIDLSPIQHFDLHATIVGGCSVFFREDDKGIYQVRPVPPGVTCHVRATLYGDGNLVGGALVGIERKDCGLRSPWRNITNSLTSTRVHLGQTILTFKYYDNEQACHYRVSAPYNDEMGRQDFVSIQTLTERH